MKVGTINFTSDNLFLEERFKWAKEMALSYAHNGEDKVGLWYEAALPERDSFCIRDISHQIYGATFLGLDYHSKNMLEKFISNISINRDYCTYWEIDKDDNPTAVDYTNDDDFWYVLLANFELVIACYQQYLFTGDQELIMGEKFEKFFQLTFHEYIDCWDIDKDGILEHYDDYGRRGLASYNETIISMSQGGDMIAVQYRAYETYSTILSIQGRTKEALFYKEQADKIKKRYLTEWYDKETQSFYGARIENGEFYQEYYEEGNFLPIYFQIFDPGEKLEQAINRLKGNPTKNVEGLTYMPQIFYRYDKILEGYNYLEKLIVSNLARNDYPEVSYLIIANYVSGLMGINVIDYLKFEIRNNGQNKNQLSNTPLFNGYLDLRYDSKKHVNIAYRGNHTPLCKVIFDGNYTYCEINKEKKEMSKGLDKNNQKISYVEISLESEKNYQINVL